MLPLLTDNISRNDLTYSVVPTGAVLLFTETDGNGGIKLMAKLPNGTYVEIGGGDSSAVATHNASLEAHSTLFAGKAAANHTHTAADVGAAAANHTHTAADVGAEAAGSVAAHNSDSNTTAHQALFNAIAANSVIPPGIVVGHSWSDPNDVWANVPNGWLPADGRDVSRTTYAALFAAIGTTYGTGDGSTTFNVPSWTATPGVYYIIKY